MTNALIDLSDIPAPSNERELSWLLSFYWGVDQAYNSLQELLQHRAEGQRPMPHLLKALTDRYDTGLAGGLDLAAEGKRALADLGIG